MKYDGLKISKESVEKIFPRRDIGDIDLSGYKSPINVMVERINGQIEYEAKNAVYREIRRIGVEVDKNELIKALRYDREQYYEGYRNGYANAEKALSEWRKITYTVDEYGSIVFDENQPPFNKFVNVYCPENGCIYTAYWSYSDREWKIPSVTTNETLRLKVSHWMPTPLPPKER